MGVDVLLIKRILGPKPDLKKKPDVPQVREESPQNSLSGGTIKEKTSRADKKKTKGGKRVGI